MKLRIVHRERATIAIAVLLAISVSGCFQNSYDVQCVANGSTIELAWTADPSSDRYRVYRVVAGGTLAEVGQVTGTSYVDGAVAAGTDYHYLVRPIGPDGIDTEGTGECSVTAAAGPDAPDAVGALTCRAKSGKVDVSWQPAGGAVSYRVLRAPAASPLTELAEIASPPFADYAVIDGHSYEYAVMSVGADGATAAQSTSCSATPGPNGGGESPAPVADLTCRGKRDKVDLAWSAVADAAFYRVFRSVGGVTSEMGEVANAVFVDFGLTPSAVHEYVVRAVAADGTESADSTACSYAATDRDGGNQGPSITSTPVTNALERELYQYEVVATDPEGDAVTLSIAQAPSGMFFRLESNMLVWTPIANQIGPHTVEVRATDPQGAFGTQAYVVDAADFNEPPRITSVPDLRAQVGELYQYDVEAFDPESSALAFSFADPPPSGMTIDPVSGVISWTPSASALAQAIVVRASDAGGAFDDQAYTLDATLDPLVLSAPEGSFSVEVGDTLELRFVTNYPLSRYFARPLPKGATLEGDLFRFTPEPGQAGHYDLIFKAAFNDLRDMNSVAITVTDANAPPVFGALGPFVVAEGGLLRFPVAATDPDGDALTISAPALSLENAVFDEFSRELIFQPSFEQAGAYDVVFRAGDGVAAVDTHVAITVNDAVPPVGDLDLVVNPPQSPTFVRGQTISGSITGEVASVATPLAALVTGLAPTNAQQGRPATIAITGRNTAFVQGETTATFGEGVTVDTLLVSSPTQAVATVSVSATAPVGIRQMRVQSGGQEIPSVVAFRIEPGAAIVRGRLVDSFTGEPLAGVRVTVNGTNASAITGADGSFEIVGVPGGAQTLVAVAPNFDVLELPVNVEQNATYDLGEPLGLDSLARPARPGGSLPRAQTLASVLDRGISTIDQPMSKEQAALVISDTMIAIGGNQLGVVDENGVQLNPRLVGPGMLSLTPASLDYFAERQIHGQVFTLGEVAFAIRGSFGWIFKDVGLDSLLLELQVSVNRAWLNASDPAFALPIVIFNPGGVTLSNEPPILSADTRLNSFQAFLLFMSFVGRNFTTVDLALDVKLQDLDIDPRTLLEEAGIDGELYGALLPHERPNGGIATRLAQRAVSWAGVAGDLAFGPPAHAQAGAAANIGGRFVNVFDVLWTNGRSTYSSAFQSGVFGVAIAGGIAIGLALCGFAAPLAAFAVIGTFLVGFLTTVFAKMVGAFFTDRNMPTNYEPRPPALINQVDPTVDEPYFSLRFVRSPQDLESDRLRREHPNLSLPEEAFGWISEIWRYPSGTIDRRLLDHRYFLWKYDCDPVSPPCQATRGGSEAGRVPLERNSFLAPLDPSDLEDEALINDPQNIFTQRRANAGELEQFRILKTRLSEGANYFRIQTIQFYRRMWNGINPDEEFVGVPMASIKVESPAWATVENAEQGVRANYLAELTRIGVENRAEHKSNVAEGKTAMLEEQRARAQLVTAQTQRDRFLTSQHAAKILEIGPEIIEEGVKVRLDELNAKIDPVRPKIQAHYDLASAVEQRLGAPGGTTHSPDGIVEEMLDPSTTRGQELRAHLEATPGSRQLLEDYVTSRLYRDRGAQGAALHGDAANQLRAVRSELQSRVREWFAAHPNALPSEYPDIDLGPAGHLDLPDGPRTLGLYVEPTVHTQSFDVPRVTNAAEFSQAIRQLEDAIETHEFQVRRTIETFEEPTGIFQRDHLAKREAFQQAFYDPETYRADIEQLDIAKHRYDTAQRIPQVQNDVATADARYQQVRAKGLQVFGTGPRGFAGVEEGLRLNRATRNVQGALNGIRAQVPLDIGAKTGVVVETFTELTQTRSNIDILPSNLSETIVVNAHFLPPDPETGKARIEVTSAPVTATVQNMPTWPTKIAGDFDPSATIEVASRYGETPEPELPDFATGLARGALARLFRRPLAIDDAGRSVFAGKEPAALRMLRRAQFTGPAGLPIQFETDPDPEQTLAVLYPAGPPPDNPRDGFLFRDYPFTPPPAERFGAGFPSELIAVDSDGRVYLQNYNSNEQFGGRIFRFAGIPAEREHVGSVNYFSQLLMSASPAFPIAMEIGDVITPAHGLVEDLFVANKDLGVYYDQNLGAVNRVLRIPVSEADRNPFYANGQNRHRLVGQPWAQHPDFDFGGPTDMESDARDPSAFTNGTRPLYMSDGESLFFMRDTDHDGTADTAKIAEVPGRVFSGLASDQNGNLFVADFARGEVYLIPQQLLDDIVAGAQPIFTSDEDLDARAFLIKVDLDRPGDIELDSHQHRYIVSTPGGLVPFDIPIVGRLVPDLAEIHVNAIDAELPVQLRRDRGNMFEVGANSEGTFNGKIVRFRVRRLNGGTGQSVWSSLDARTQLFGATVLRDDALVLRE